MVKNASNQKRTTFFTMKNLLLPQLSASEIFLLSTISEISIFSSRNFAAILETCSQKKQLVKFCLQKVGVGAGFL